MQGKNRYILTLLGRKLSARQISAVTRILAEQGMNIDAKMCIRDRDISPLPAPTSRIRLTSWTGAHAPNNLSLIHIFRLKTKYKASIYVDEAHGLGVFGKQGRGVCDHFGVTEDIDLILSLIHILQRK